MFWIKKIGLVFVPILMLMSCSKYFFDKKIDIDIKGKEQRLAGTAIFGFKSDFFDYNNNPDRILVSFTQNPLNNNNKLEAVKTARVLLKSDDLIVNFNIFNSFYAPSTQVPFEANKTYKLTITHPGYQTIVATQVYPENVPILEASLTNEFLNIKIKDNPSQRNYYLLKLISGKWVSDGGNRRLSFFTEEQLSISKQARIIKESGFCSTCVLFDDSSFNGLQDFKITISVNQQLENRVKNFGYKVLLYHVTEDFYLYDIALRVSREAKSNPFSEPVTLLGNFDGGYGVFLLMNKSEYIISF